MSNIFIIHGVEGHPEENWFPWLKSKLENLGHKVFIPQFPTPENQTLENWLKIFEKYKEYFNKDAIVIGHSLGVVFLLSCLEKYEFKAAFFVAIVFGKIENQFADSMKNFTGKTFNFQKIKANCSRFYLFHSDNDPYLKIENGLQLAKSLGVKLRIIKNAGHFNTASSYNKFELLLDRIKTELHL